jgi:hypothetical protein
MEEVLMEYLKDREADSVRQLMTAQATSASQRLQLESKLTDALASKRAERSRALIDGFQKTPLTYVMSVMEFADGSWLIKIGWSDDIMDRAPAVSTAFGVKVAVLDVFPCEKHKLFEKFAHAHEKVAPYKYNELVNGKVKSTEVFLLPNASLYAGIKRMMQMEVSRFERRNVRELELLVEGKKLDAEMQRYKVETQKYALMETLLKENMRDAVLNLSLPQPIITCVPETVNNEIITCVPETVNNEITPEAVTNFSQNLTGPIVRTYLPNDLATVVAEYGGITEAVRKVEQASYSQIKTSAVDCTLYLGRRWQLVARDEQDIHVPMQETVAHQVRQTGYVAIMADDGASIVDVYTLSQ